MSQPSVKVHLPDIVGQGYASFWHSKLPYRVVKGGRGSKKSATAALWYIYHIMKHPLANALVVRQVANTHRDSTWAQLQWATHRLKVAHLWQFKANPMEAVYKPTGQRILFRGFDDPLKITSITVPVGVLCWVWIEEAYEIEDESAFDTLDESIRGEMPDGLWKQFTLTFNPWIDSHWTKARWFDKVDPRAFTLTTTYRCNEWLDDADRQKIEVLAETNPDRYRVVGLGEYGLPGGVYFDEFRRDIHVIRPFDIPEHWTRFRAMDYGFDMLAVGWFAVDPQSRLILYRELYEPGHTVSKAAKRIIEMSGNEHYDYTACSPDLWGRNHETGIPEAETLVGAGITGLVKADNRRVTGWRHLREYISVYEVPSDLGPRKTANLVIFDCCPNVIRTLSAITKDIRNPEDASDQPHEVTHAPEMVRYGVMTRPKASGPLADDSLPVGRTVRIIREREGADAIVETEEYL